uniref:Bestrophin homolog n=1 Tax=Panagrolaimus sp. JU765 TaxID=591449 RepID=A0AC34QK11_9BILA
MTVTYSLDVSTSTFCGIHKILFRWKGSLWKAIWKELCLWLFVYAILSAIYRTALNSDQQAVFEDVVEFCYVYSDYIPLTFMLGFYVQAVFNRWNKIFDNLGWIDSSALLITSAIKGSEENVRMIRRNIVRYMVLVQALVLRNVSSNVKRRFPTINHLVTAGLMTENELREFDSVVSPQVREGNISLGNWELHEQDSDIILMDVMDKIRQYRQNVLSLTLYDWVPIPLVYTQTVNLTVRSFFVIALMGRQYLIHDRDTPNAKTIDLFVPFMSILQFLFYVGWMKVAEVMLNPLGDDDDDFECNWIIDRNLQVGLQIADSYGRLPQLEKDIFWNEMLPEPLYTAESATRTQNPIVGSCNNLHVHQQKRRISDLLLPTNWRPEHSIDKETSEIARILNPNRRFMSSTAITSDRLPYAEPSEIPVLRYNRSRRASNLDPIFLRHEPMDNENVDGKEFSRQESVPLGRIENYIDGIQDRRKLSELAKMDPESLHFLLAQLSKAENNAEDDEESMTSPESSYQPSQPSPQQNWMTVNEMLPVIHEEDDRRQQRSEQPSNVSSVRESYNDLASESPQIVVTAGTPQEPQPSTQGGHRESFVRLKSLIKKAALSKSSPKLYPRTDTSRYQNFGFHDEWDEHSAPGDLEPVEPDRPKFKLSESSETSDPNSNSK